MLSSRTKIHNFYLIKCVISFNFFNKVNHYRLSPFQPPLNNPSVYKCNFQSQSYFSCFLTLGYKIFTNKSINTHWKSNLKILLKPHFNKVIPSGMGKNYHGLELITSCFAPFSCFWALQKWDNGWINHPTMTNMVWKDGTRHNLEFFVVISLKS